MHKLKHTTLAALLALALALSGLFALPMRSYAAGTIVYVDASAGGVGDGSSWVNAYPSLADALAGAASGTEIWVAQGTYKPTSGSDRTATFQLKDGVAIYGGFKGDETQRDGRDWQTNVTTLSGDLNGDDSDAVSRPDPTRVDNSYSVVAGATGATLDGVTITGGYTDVTISASIPRFGGGMYNKDSSPTLANVIISGNVTNFGGGMYNDNSNPTLTNVTISDNFGGNGGGMYNNNSSPTLADVAINGNVSYVGGGMVNQNSSPTLTDVTISGNSALLAGGGYGGGMYNIGSSPTLTHVTFRGNASDRGGGGMYNTVSSPVLTHVTFDGNSSGFDGGGLYSTGLTNMTLTDVTFTGNVATFGYGGGMYTIDSPTLTNVIFSGNSAKNGGGLCIFFGNNATLTNVIFSGNSATNGGGMYNFGTSNLAPMSVTMTNVSISGNSAPNGGGMYNTNSSTPQVRNSILWSNGSSNVSNNNSTPVFSSSIVQGAGGSGAPWSSSFGTDGGGNLDADPLFVSSSDLHLGPGSPAINAGNNSFLPAGLTTDLDGNPRIVGGTVDMGAYEVQDTTPPETTITSKPPSSTVSTDAVFSFIGTDDMTPAENLIFECSLDGASIASCTSSTSYSNLAAESHTFQVRAIDAAGNVDPTPASYTWTIVSTAPTTLLYNGGQIVNVGSSFTPAALLSSSAPACLPGQVVSFALDANPLTGADGAYALGTATTDSGGQASMPAVNTTGWLEGVYTINASFAGTSGCLPSADSATLTVASPGEAANGGGWYTLSGSGRNNFGFTVRKVDAKCNSNCAYKGQLLLINNGKWRVKGNLTSYSKTSTGQGAASGTGDLYWWNASLNGGLGDWALAQSGVSYTINFYDSGTSGKSSSDTFGIRIVYTPVAPQPSTLPNSTPQLLKGGDIKVS